MGKIVSKKLTLFVSIIVFTSTRLLSNLTTRNVHVAHYFKHVQQILCQWLGSSFYFLGSNRSTFPRYPHTFKYAMLESKPFHNSGCFTNFVIRHSILDMTSGKNCLPSQV